MALELHVSLAGPTAATAREREARKTALEGVLEGKGSGGGPQKELEGAEDGDGTRGAAHGAAAEEQPSQEDAECHETGKVKQDVGDLEREYGPGVVDFEWVSMRRSEVRCSGLTLWHELRDDLEVGDGDEGEERHKDHEVDLRWRGCKGVDVVPVCNYVLVSQSILSFTSLPGTHTIC